MHDLLTDLEILLLGEHIWADPAAAVMVGCVEPFNFKYAVIQAEGKDRGQG